MSADERILTSPLLTRHGFAHGFATRRGGVSEGPFATLNLARTIGDDPERVAENARRFEAAIGGAPAGLFEVSQVHGSAVVVVEAGASVADIRRREADALVTATPGAAVAVRTADCVPILLADPERGAVAAVHAGWRGLVAEVLASALEALGGGPSVIAAIGPHIRSFEVSEDVAAQIAGAAHGASVVTPRVPRPHVNLADVVRAQLEARGVSSIEDVGGCTLEDAARFFSHRRDAGRTGRQLAAIVAR